MSSRPSIPVAYPRSRRGQALVEFAFVLPVLVLLLVMALDLGRVFFGYVALQNASRIGANHAGTHVQAWVTGGGPAQQLVRDQYEALVLNDLEAINCDADPDNDGDSVPDPVFTNPDGTNTGDVHEDGDHATVTLECEFGLITPLAEALLGGPVAMRAESVFPVHQGSTLGLPDAPDPPDPPPGSCAAPVAEFSWSPNNAKSPVTVNFTDTSTTDVACPITAWSWDFDDGSAAGTAQNPSHGYTCSTTPRCEFDVTLTVTSDGGSDSVVHAVRVRP